MTEIFTKIDMLIIRDLKIRGEIFFLDVKGGGLFSGLEIMRNP